MSIGVMSNTEIQLTFKTFWYLNFTHEIPSAQQMHLKMQLRIGSYCWLAVTACPQHRSATLQSLLPHFTVWT